MALTNTTPTNAAGWIAIYNPGLKNAPGGTLAYAASTNATTGVIGVAATTTTVTVSRPKYLELTAAAATVSKSD